jgi:hypothetical protein
MSIAGAGAFAASQTSTRLHIHHVTLRIHPISHDTRPAGAFVERLLQRVSTPLFAALTLAMRSARVILKPR